MSGGSYNYLCYNTELDELAVRERDLLEMADRLAGLSEADFPGVTAAAKMTAGVIADLRIWRLHLTAAADRLSPVWKAVEWWDSSDSGPDGVRRALEAFVTPPPAEADGPRCPALVPFGGGVQCDKFAGHAVDDTEYGGHAWGTGPFTRRQRR